MKEVPAKLKDASSKSELLRLSYLGDNGVPQVIPVWFIPIDDTYYVATDAGHGKARALLRDPRAGWVIDGGDNPNYWGVAYSGRAQVVNDQALRSRIYTAMAEKYFSSPDDPNVEALFGKPDDPKTVYFALLPDRVRSWEY